LGEMSNEEAWIERGSSREVTRGRNCQTRGEVWKREHGRSGGGGRRVIPESPHYYLGSREKNESRRGHNTRTRADDQGKNERQKVAVLSLIEGPRRFGTSIAGADPLELVLSQQKKGRRGNH